MSEALVPENNNSAAIAAATWWANKVCNPSFNLGDPDSSFISMLAMMNVRSTPDPSKAQIYNMINALAPKIDELMIRVGSTISIAVDYGPDPILASAAKEANISTNRFPWKTVMWVCTDNVTVSEGYGAKTTLVWGTDSWMMNRPVCTQQKYDLEKARSDSNYHGEPWSCSLPQYHDEPCIFDTPVELCSVCGRTNNWFHNRKENPYSKDFHEFTV